MSDSKPIRPQERPFDNVLKRMERVMLERRCFSVSLFLFVGLVVIDQVSKKIVSRFWPHFVVCNTEGAWGISFPFPMLILMAVGILALMIGIQWRNGSFDSAFLFILAGGIGNLLDRIGDGCVTDFISVFNFPIFNGADIFLSIGCALLLRSWYREHVLSGRD